MITVNVRLFALAHDLVGKDQLQLSLDDGIHASTMLELLLQDFPKLQPWKDHLRIAVNCKYCSPDQELKHNDEVAIIPPVSGG